GPHGERQRVRRERLRDRHAHLHLQGCQPTHLHHRLRTKGRASLMTTTAITPNPTGLTPTCQDEPTIARVVDALESAWTTIRSNHPEIPTVVIIVASGSP